MEDYLLPKHRPPEIPEKQTDIKFWMLIAVFVVGVILTGVWYVYEANKTDTHLIACTADAKRCPDGSYVGREAPDCAFAECPTHKNVSNRINCEQEGGRWGKFGLAQSEYCDFPPWDQ